jgi:small subunit ribosomal protein YMR-31
MHATLLRNARTPLIQFIGKRSWPSAPKPGPHPYAPKEIADNFASFAKAQSSSAPAASASHASAYGTGFLPASKKPYDYENFYEAPSYLWQHNEMSQREIDAVMSGGATDIRTGP